MSPFYPPLSKVRIIIQPNLSIIISRYPHSGSFVKSTDVNHGNKFVEALKEQYDYDVIKAREDYENSMKDFPVAVFDFANLEKVKRLQG